MNYTEIVAEWANIAADSSTEFTANIPATIAYVEGRATRDLDLMAANITDTGTLTSSGSNTIHTFTTSGTYTA